MKQTNKQNLKKNAKGRKLSAGKTIGGRGRLTDSEINQIQAYYGNAIRGNTNNLVGIKAAVWAIFFLTSFQLMRSPITTSASNNGVTTNKQRLQELYQHLLTRETCQLW